MTDFPLAATGVINAKIIQCSGGGWTWSSLGDGGFAGRRTGGDDDNGGGGGNNPTTGSDGTHAETTGEESQEVSLGLSQSLMLDGESFQATLTLNSIVTPTVQNITVTLLISDASGADARDLFTIVPAPPTDLGDLPGGGQVVGDWLIVPTVEVTRSEGEDFRIRAQLDYDYEGQAYRFTTIEETITVFPAPELIIDYELPEADLVCTTFDLRATFRNVGAGPARNLRLTGGQPRVTKNTGNTPQSFKVTRVAVNGVEAANVTMALDIGDIPPGGFGEVVWRIEAEEAGRFIDFSSDYRMLNYLGEALAPSLRGINTTFAPPSDPFEYGCLTDAFSVSGYVRTENDNPIPGITVASASGRTAVTNADGYYILPGLVTGTYTIVPTRTGYTFLPETDAASVPPSVTDLNFVANSGPVNVRILDADGNPVSALTTNDEGWPTPNPLTVQVTLNCPADGPDCDYPIDFTIDAGGSPGRFYVYEATLNPIDLDEAGYLCSGDMPNSLVHLSSTTYSLDCLTFFSLTSGSSASYTWQVWVQPSEAATLTAQANFGPESDTEQVSVAAANIHPVVFLHGILGSMPPGESIITEWPQQIDGVNLSSDPHLDPFTGSYRPLINNLLKMGYEIDDNLDDGVEGTFFPVTYDWRKSNLNSAAWLNEVLDTYVDAINLPYVHQDRKADVVVHSMGGMVLRSYLQGMATTGAPANVTVHAYPELQRLEYTGPVPYTGNVPYQDNVNKAVFIATPHRGFPFDYATWEGLTWKDYLDEDVDWNSQFIPGVLLKTLDHLLWPYMIIERYDPDWLSEPCALPWFLENIPILSNALSGGICPNEVLYKYSHSNPYDPSHPGIGSLSEMLPDERLSILPDKTTNLSQESYLFPDPFYPSDQFPAELGRQTNFLLEDLGLNDPGGVENKLNQAVGLGNLYVLYNEARDTVVSYNVAPPPGPGECLDHDYLPEYCYRNPVIQPYYSDLIRWPHGLVIDPTSLPGNESRVGDNLIPRDSTTLHKGELIDLDLYDLLNQELSIGNDDTGHVMIAAKEQTQDVVGAILTGLFEPSDPNLSTLFPVNTPYVAPTLLANNVDVIWAFLVRSPIDVMVTDPQGRRVGYDPSSGQVINEIPGAYYTGNGSDIEFVLIGKEGDGDFTITTTGTDSGDYAVSAHRVGNDRVRLVGVITGTTQLSQVNIALMEIKDTQLVVEAEQFESNISHNGQTWSLMSHLDGYTGTGYLKIGPDRDVFYDSTDLSIAPELQYTLNFSITGTYHLWLSGAGSNAAGDSVYVALAKQGELPTAPLPISGFPPNQWGWSKQTLSDSPATVTVDTIGLYTLYIWPREDGVQLDRILLTNDSTYYFPIGVGPSGSSE